MNWNSVNEGIAAGVAASVLLATFSIAREMLRDFGLRRRIRRQFRHVSFGAGLAGFTVGVRNHLGKPFTVRQIVLLGKGTSYRLNPTGQVTTSFEHQHRKLSRKQIRMLKRGEIDKIEINSEVASGPWTSTPTPEGFTVIEPYTHHNFVLPAHLVANFSGTVEGVVFTVEYESWTGARRIMQVRRVDNLDTLLKMFDSLVADIRSGSYDEARAMFNMPPIASRDRRGASQHAQVDESEKPSAPA